MTKIRIIATLLAIMMLASLIMGCQNNTQQTAEALPTFEELKAINSYKEVFKNHTNVYVKNTNINNEDPSESVLEEAILMPGDGKIEFHMTSTDLKTNTVLQDLSRVGNEWYSYDVEDGMYAILEIGASFILDISIPDFFGDVEAVGKAYVEDNYIVHHASAIYEAWEDIEGWRYDYTYYFNKETHLLEKVLIKYYDGDHVCTEINDVVIEYDVNVSDVFELTLFDRVHGADNRINVEIILGYNTENEKKYNLVATTDSIMYAAVLDDVTYTIYSDPECKNEVTTLDEYEGLKSVTLYAAEFVYEEVRYTVTEEEWNYWTTHKNYTIEQYYGDDRIINKYTEGALQFEDGDIILFIDDKQYTLYETEDGYVAHDVTNLEFTNNGLLSGGYVYDEFTYDETRCAYVLDLIEESGMIWEVKFEDGVPVSVVYNEIEDGVITFTSTSNYINVGTTVVDIPEYVFEEEVEDTTRYTTTEEEWNLNLGAGNYSGSILSLIDGDFLKYSYKCTNNAIELDGMLVVFEGDTTYMLQESEGVWYAFESEEGLGIPTMVPQGVNFSDYEYNENNKIYVPKVKTGAELYYSFGFADGALSYVLLQTTLDESDPEYYEVMAFTIEEIGTVVIEIPEYIILE